MVANSCKRRRGRRRWWQVAVDKEGFTMEVGMDLSPEEGLGKKVTSMVSELSSSQSWDILGGRKGSMLAMGQLTINRRSC